MSSFLFHHQLKPYSKSLLAADARHYMLSLSAVRAHRRIYQIMAVIGSKLQIISIVKAGSANIIKIFFQIAVAEFTQSETSLI